MKWKIDDIPVFVAVVEQGGISAAADVLGQPKSTVSTTLARLEHALGLRLVDRNSRNLRVTEEGEVFYRQSLLILDQVREADAAAAGLSAAPSGRVVAAMPPAFTQEVVAPQIATFQARWPRLELDLVLTTQGVELLRDQVDLAVVVGPMVDSELVSRVLVAGPLAWVTSPAYAASHDLTGGTDSIRPHVRICEKRYGRPRMPVRVDGAPTHIDLSTGISHVNSPLVAREAVANGAGVSALPRLYMRESLASGRLVEVFRNVTFDLDASVLSVVYPHRRLLSPRLRVFVDFLEEVCRSHADR
ncbi:DNA-binding transcriptional LysR family regulator [Maritimibacter alkaliphilus HTCC2654]|uniref:Probable transcriptional regulator n=1 Tax=Maritimibacter alkaliphilus HTCC2654 TaxID=314271 RepID=A3VK31_9RHOB|nr:LysR family transcriptional regulator [Maritimibacter alkaliphilus]EAQ11336.1 probable transcriptional regulator [Rhodobacterales bacterium HTCC2654] [Maritimibacter alkaliphilus HTCC2654]TYP80042.1 DNA-binding transcriptional LysR family regulator [Maritimibacter alkaliphilus HTCC2654]